MYQRHGNGSEPSSRSSRSCKSRHGTSAACGSASSSSEEELLRIRRKKHPPKVEEPPAERHRRASSRSSMGSHRSSRHLSNRQSVTGSLERSAHLAVWAPTWCGPCMTPGPASWLSPYESVAQCHRCCHSPSPMSHPYRCKVHLICISLSHPPRQHLAFISPKPKAQTAVLEHFHKVQRVDSWNAM